jgi:sporulation protein YlmC with PRC-barrel domain
MPEEMRGGNLLGSKETAVSYASFGNHIMRARLLCLVGVGMSPLLFAALAGQSVAQSHSAPFALAAPDPGEHQAMVFEGYAVFGSDGRRIGRVSKINRSNGRLSSIEVESRRCLGFFRKTYTVPSTVIRSGGTIIELSLTRDEVELFKRVDRL